MNTQERIDDAVAGLSDGARISYEEALAAGNTDEACPLCPKVLLAHEHVGECGRTPCFFAAGPLERSAILAKCSSQTADQNQLGIDLQTP